MSDEDRERAEKLRRTVFMKTCGVESLAGAGIVAGAATGAPASANKATLCADDSVIELTCENKNPKDNKKRKHGGAMTSSVESQRSSIEGLSKNKSVQEYLRLTPAEFVSHFEPNDKIGKVYDKMCCTYITANHLADHVRREKHKNAVNAKKNKKLNDDRIVKFLKSACATDGYTRR